MFSIKRFAPLATCPHPVGATHFLSNLNQNFDLCISIDSSHKRGNIGLK